MDIGNWISRVRTNRPLVDNITNLVVTNTVANALLAVGASPVMAYAHEEVSEMARISNALVLNIGTLTPDVITSMRLAGMSANTHGVPIVLDPVGVGSTPYRTDMAASLARELKLTVLRGNAGEIGVLIGAGGKVTGVDSSGAGDNLPLVMKDYAEKHQTVVVATGEQDIITDGADIWILKNGHPFLSLMTGSGCALTGIIGAFTGVVDPGSPLSTYAEATIAAVTCLNVAAEIASDAANGPGTFQAALFDAIYHLSEEKVSCMARVERLAVEHER